MFPIAIKAVRTAGMARRPNGRLQKNVVQAELGSVMQPAASLPLSNEVVHLQHINSQEPALVSAQTLRRANGFIRGVVYHGQRPCAAVSMAGNSRTKTAASVKPSDAHTIERKYRREQSEKFW